MGWSGFPTGSSGLLVMKLKWRSAKEAVAWAEKQSAPARHRGDAQAAVSHTRATYILARRLRPLLLLWRAGRRSVNGFQTESVLIRSEKRGARRLGHAASTDDRGPCLTGEA